MEAIKMESVNSSNIKEIGYNAKNKVMLVKFHTGAMYSYSMVTAKTYNEFKNAQSVGKYFATNIKDKYPTLKVEEKLK